MDHAFQTDDISLRSSSGSVSRALIEHLSKSKYGDVERTQLIDRCIIPLVLSGFKNEQDVSSDMEF